MRTRAKITQLREMVAGTTEYTLRPEYIRSQLYKKLNLLCMSDPMTHDDLVEALLIAEVINHMDWYREAHLDKINSVYLQKQVDTLNANLSDRNVQLALALEELEELKGRLDAES